MGNSAQSKQFNGDTATTRTTDFFVNPPSGGSTKPEKYDGPESPGAEDEPWPLHICRMYSATNQIPTDSGLWDPGSDAPNSNDVNIDTSAKIPEFNNHHNNNTNVIFDNECDCFSFKDGTFLNSGYDEAIQSFQQKGQVDVFSHARKQLPGLKKPYGDFDFVNNENGQMYVILEEVQKRMKEINTFEPVPLDAASIQREKEESIEKKVYRSKLQLAVKKENLPGLPKPYRNFSARHAHSEIWPAFESLAMVRNYLPLTIESNGVITILRGRDLDVLHSPEDNAESDLAIDSISCSNDSGPIQTSRINGADGDKESEVKQEDEICFTETEINDIALDVPTEPNVCIHHGDLKETETSECIRDQFDQRPKARGLGWIRKADLDEAFHVFHPVKSPRANETSTSKEEKKDTAFEKGKTQVLSIDKFKELKISQKVENLANVFSRTPLVNTPSEDDEDSQVTVPYMYQGFLDVISNKINSLKSSNLTKTACSVKAMCEKWSKSYNSTDENSTNKNTNRKQDSETEIHLEFDRKQYLLQAEKSLEFFQAVENVVQNAANNDRTSSCSGAFPQSLKLKEKSSKGLQGANKKVSETRFELKSKSEGHLVSPCSVCCFCKDKWGNNFRAVSDDVSEMTASIIDEQPSYSESSARTMPLRNGLAVADVHDQSLNSSRTSLEEKSERESEREPKGKDIMVYEISTPVLKRNQPGEIRKTRSDCTSKQTNLPPEQMLPARQELESASETLVQADTLADLTDWATDLKETSYDFTKPMRSKLMMNWLTKPKFGNKKSRNRCINDEAEEIVSEREADYESWSASSGESSYSSTLLPIWTGHKRRQLEAMDLHDGE